MTNTLGLEVARIVMGGARHSLFLDDPPTSADKHFRAFEQRVHERRRAKLSCGNVRFQPVSNGTARRVPRI
jgi:hypothetical protein